MSHYYVIQVYTGAEQKAIDAIKRGIPKDVINDAFCVIKRRKKKFAKTWHVVEENCFPGYVFLESDDPQQMCRFLTTIHLYARVLGFNKETFFVKPIDEKERFFIDSITDRNPDRRLIDLSEIKIEEGQTVSIVSGPLKGFEGKVVKFDLHHRKASVEVNILGSPIKIDLGIEILQKTDK